MGRIKELLLDFNYQEAQALFHQQQKRLKEECPHDSIEEIGHEPELNIQGCRVCHDCGDVLEWFTDYEPDPDMEQD